MKKNHEHSERKKLSSLFNNKNTIKYSRITYHVFWNLALLFIIILAAGFSFAGGVGAGYFAALVKDEPVRSKDELRKDIYDYEETSEVYFADKKFLGKLSSDLEREEVPLSKVSKHLINAVIATEDEYFHEHNGVVPKAIMRAVFQEMTNSSVQSGGSTLTQQLIKNQVLTNEVSFERKAKEILLALRVEKFFEKDEILQTYLNISTFGRNSSGNNIAGVQSAAKGLFGKDAKKLNLPQAAFIAGLPQSPFGYTPYTQKGELKENLNPGLERMKTVLKRMYAGGYITEKEYKKALAYKIKKDFIGPQPQPLEEYPWLTIEIEKRSIDILKVILAKKDGYSEKDLKKDKELMQQYTTLANRDLRQNGYKIYSTIDKKIYEKMQATAKNYAYYGSAKNQEVTDPDTKKKKIVAEPVETGAVLIENKTGKIISFVGGRDYKREQTNHATLSKRPNGSTMKPLLVYAPALEAGTISPASVAANVPLSINHGAPTPWLVKNYGFSYTGLTTARTALAKSYNSPAAIFYMDIFNQKPAAYLNKMGFTSLTEADYHNPSLSLGALSTGVTVEENVNAFAALANGGKFTDAYMIDKIVTKDGKAIYKHKPKPVKVFSPETAYLTIDMMRDVITEGTAASLNGRLSMRSDWAGKTGTGSDYRDAWFVASNPEVSFGTWMGYDTPKPLEQTYAGLSYSKRNIYLWAELMNDAMSVKPELAASAKRFDRPGGIVERSICSVSGLLPSEACKKAGMVKTDLFNAKHVPTKTDDSFINGKYVQVGDLRYAALPETPDEFASKGFMLNPDYFEKIGGKYIADAKVPLSKNENWKNLIIPSAILKDNGKSPSAPSISKSGSAVVWSKHPESDVVGYRVYANGRKVGSIKAGETLSYKSGGSVTVTAVDVAGRESAHSNAVKMSGTVKKKDSDDSKKKKKKDKEKKPESDNDPGGGDSEEDEEEDD